MTPPTLYAAFGSKQGLYCEALAAYSAAGPAAAPPQMSAYRIVEAFLHRRAELFTDPARPPGCMMATAPAPRICTASPTQPCAPGEIGPSRQNGRMFR